MSASTVDVVTTPDGREQLVRNWLPPMDTHAILVLVHGYAEHSGRYEHVGRRLAARGIAVHSTDLRGHGRSSGERASVGGIGELLADVRVALERARASSAGRRCFLLGHSMGGLVATRLFLEAQQDLGGLVLSGAAVGDPSGFESLLELDPLPEIVLSADLLASDPQVGRDYDTDPLNYRGPFRRETLRALGEGAREVRERWQEIRHPVLVLHGGDDAIVPPGSSEELFAAIASPDKELTVYPGLRHEILNEPAGPAIVDRIAAWIASRA